jgi:hypothetical protein
MAWMMRSLLEATNMTKKLLLAAGSLMLFLGTIAIQGCFDSGPGYGPGYYASGPAYNAGPAYYAQPAYVGDYDEHRNWHDRNWWVNNRRDWVQDHHKEWIAHNEQREARQHSDRDHDKN